MMKILIRTNERGKVEVFNKDTMEIVKNVGRIDIHVSSYGTPSAIVTFKDIELDLNVNNVTVKQQVK